MGLNADGSNKLAPMDAVGSGSVQEKQQAYGRNHPEGERLVRRRTGDDDQLVYVNGVLKGKLLENETLVKQAGSNSKNSSPTRPTSARP